jgi:hypothetical protein
MSQGPFPGGLVGLRIGSGGVRRRIASRRICGDPSGGNCCGVPSVACRADYRLPRWAALSVNKI